MKSMGLLSLSPLQTDPLQFCSLSCVAPARSTVSATRGCGARCSRSPRSSTWVAGGPKQLNGWGSKAPGWLGVQSTWGSKAPRWLGSKAPGGPKHLGGWGPKHLGVQSTAYQRKRLSYIGCGSWHHDTDRFTYQAVRSSAANGGLVGLQVFDPSPYTLFQIYHVPRCIGD